MKKIKNKNVDHVKKKGLFSYILTVLLSLMIIAIIAGLVFMLYIILSSPDFDKEKLYSKEATVIYDKNGNELARIGQQNRELITYDDLPQVYIDALVATEDSRYFQHNGIDIARFLKATVEQLLKGGGGGASTLSMQVIKNTYTKGSNSESKIQSIFRKFRDIYMAVFKLESNFSKEEIMEFYTNSQWFGNDGSVNYTGIYGVEQASQYYFGKSVSDLTLAESSLLVGMYKNPNTYNPYKKPENARTRQKTVLSLMVRHGYITQEQMDDALAIPVSSLLVDREEESKVSEYQATIDYIISDVEEETGLSPYTESLTIYSTIDLKVQTVLTNIDQYHKFPYEKAEVGIAVTSTEDGSIVALYGGRNYVAKGNNHAIIRQQPGSTAKPFFDYGPYFEYLNGSTADYFLDEAYSYSNGQRITNADNGYKGLITLRYALSTSRNIPALKAFQKVNELDDTLIPEYVHGFGIDYGDDLYESYSIGSFEGISPLELSAAYATYGRGGEYIKPYSFTKVIDSDGKVYEHKVTTTRACSEQTAYLINSVLMTAASNGTTGRYNITGTQVAAKTGTTNLTRDTIKTYGLPSSAIADAWVASYTSEYSISLWYGYDKLEAEQNLTQSEGYNGKLAVMNAIAKKIYSTNKTFKKPSGIVAVTVEKDTIPIQLASEYTPDDMKLTGELFRSGTEPTDVSQRYAQLNNPTNVAYSVNENIVTINWDEIATPDWISEEFLLNYFNENYENYAQKYYEARLLYNSENVGTVGYQIYVKENDDTLTPITWISGSTYTQTVEPGQTYTFVVKSSYSIYKANESTGIEISFTVPGAAPTPEEN